MSPPLSTILFHRRRHEQPNLQQRRLPRRVAAESGRSISDVLKRVRKVVDRLGDPRVKLRAADRAVAGRAPFHRNKNSVADAILIETYADLVREGLRRRALRLRDAQHEGL
jgi:hypothetical protein